MDLNNDLIKYLEDNIIPMYQTLDLAHREEHARAVIESSLIIAKDYEVDINMVYTVAVFHDVGLTINRKDHHIIGGKMLENDEYIKSIFEFEQIEIMKEAVEDHRASSSDKPRSIYGLIISEADLFDEAEMIIKRSFLYRMNDGEEDFQNLYNEVKLHIENKYGFNGYLKSWLNSKRVAEMLDKLRYLLENTVEFEACCMRIYEEIKIENA